MSKNPKKPAVTVKRKPGGVVEMRTSRRSNIDLRDYVEPREARALEADALREMGDERDPEDLS